MLIPDLTLFCMPPFYFLLFQNLLHENTNITHSYVLYKLLHKLPNSFFNQIFCWTQKVLNQNFFQSKFFLAIFFDWSFLWSQFIFGPQIIVNQIFFLPIFGYKISIGFQKNHANTHKLKYIQIFYLEFLDQRLLDPKFFGPKFCYGLLIEHSFFNTISKAIMK